MSERQTTYEAHPDRLPEPDQKQVALGFEAIRRALAGQEMRLYSDERGRLCVVPLERGDVERA